jgi:hypothetical protein
MEATVKYLTIDAALHGTGIRDYYNTIFINPGDLNLSDATVKRINEWLLKYENEFYKGYVNDDVIKEFDAEGIKIALTIKNELVEAKIEYLSDARMTRVMI